MGTHNTTAISTTQPLSTQHSRHAHSTAVMLTAQKACAHPSHTCMIHALQDGSALFVTVAKYRTPAGSEIDHLGINPDTTCTPASLLGSGATSGATSSDGGVTSGVTSSGGVATEFLDSYVPGLPAGAEATAALAEQLAADRCVLTAQTLLRQARPAPAVASAATHKTMAFMSAPLRVR